MFALNSCATNQKEMLWSSILPAPFVLYLNYI
nr:MAG TPA: hypothetical protein [Caudoviricetes sp.]